MNIELLYRFLRFLFVILCIVVGSITLYYTATVTYPFIIALIFAFIMNPIVNFLQKRGKLPRPLAVLISISLFFAFLAGLLTLLIAEVISGSKYLARIVPEHFESLVLYIEEYFTAQIIPFYNQITTLFKDLGTNQQSTIISNIEKVGANFARNVSGAVEQILNSIPNILGALPNAATVIVFSLLATFFISKDWYKFGEYYEKLIPERARKSSSKVLFSLKKALFGFIKAQCTLITITAIIVLVGLLIFRVEYAITIAVIIGFVDILPYLGTGLVFVPWIVYSFFTDQAALGIQLSVLYVIVIVQRQLMEPKILSSNIGLDPFATLVSLFVGFKLFGFLGLIIGPVFLVIVKTLHQADVFKDLWSFIVGKKA